MAKIGLKRPSFALLTEGVGKDTYADKTSVGKAIKADIKINKSDVKLPADDEIAETDNSVTTGTISLEVDEIGTTVYCTLLGHSVDKTTSEITCNVNDQSPYVGFGFMGTKKVNGKLKYRAVWFPKVKFSEPDDSNQTRGETVSFGTQSIEGLIVRNSVGVWKYENTFDTEQEADAYIDAKAGVKASV